MSTSHPIDETIEEMVRDLGPQEAARVLAQLTSRAATRLHNLARTEAAARKEQPDWAGWAQLQNASRSLVLQASTCRDLAAKLPQ